MHAKKAKLWHREGAQGREDGGGRHGAVRSQAASLHWLRAVKLLASRAAHPPKAPPPAAYHADV